MENCVICEAHEAAGFGIYMIPNCYQTLVDRIVQEKVSEALKEVAEKYLEKSDA